MSSIIIPINEENDRVFNFIFDIKTSQESIKKMYNTNFYARIFMSITMTNISSVVNYELQSYTDTIYSHRSVNQLWILKTSQAYFG